MAWIVGADPELAGKAWAGASHWRFRSAAQRAAAAAAPGSADAGDEGDANGKTAPKCACGCRRPRFRELQCQTEPGLQMTGRQCLARESTEVLKPNWKWMKCSLP